MGWKSTLAGGALVAMLAATGCNGSGGAKVATLDAGNGSSDQSSASDDSSSTSFEDAFVAYTGCMRDHGVDMPDPTFQSNGSGSGGFAVTAAAGGDGGPMVGPDSAEFKAADDACKPLLDAAMKDAPKPSAEELAAQTDKMLAFAKCMRDHGIDMPDPVIGGDGSVQVQVGGPASSASDGAATAAGPDPAVEAAAKECAPDGPGFGTTTGGGSSAGVVVANGAAG